ncbi:MAG: glycoside hydrolase family 28 protein, partial [Thermoguttaceae bacterium]
MNPRSVVLLVLACGGAALAAAGTVAADLSPALFDVRSFGALGDGKTIDTRAIQSAIDACGKAGGGRVLLPQGSYLSATVRLRSGVDFHLAQGARLVGIADPEAYGGFDADTWGKTRWNHGLIVGEGLHDISITGAGQIDGNKVFDPRGEEKMRGPHAVLLADCRNVTLCGVTLHEAANYALLFYGSSKVLVDGVTFEGGWDGVHFRGKPDAWNHDVRITGCKFYTGDDSIAGHYVEDGVVENCVVNSSCNGVRLIGPARRLTFSRCEFFGPGKFEHRTSRDLHRTNMLAALCIQPS